MKHELAKYAAAVAAAVVCLAGSATIARAEAPRDEITYTKDVLPIFQHHCQGCHRPAGLNMGGIIAPMPLVTYQDARPWAKSIAREVRAKNMPPWLAAPRFHGKFQNERTLTEKEIGTVLDWVRQGSKRGRDEDAPPALEWPETEWTLGEPDLVLAFEEPYHVNDGVEDKYVDLNVEITQDDLPEDRWLKGIEFKAGSEVVHHIIGYTYQRGEKSLVQRRMVGGIAPGRTPGMLPEGYGLLLKKGSVFQFQMHYHKEPGPGTAVDDVSQVGFWFYDRPVRQAHITAVADIGRLDVPPGDANYRIVSSYKIEKPIQLFFMMPHMHLRGSYARYDLRLPDGGVQTLLEVPQYDFNWQTNYRCAEPVDIPGGTTIEVTMGYDNSPGNPDNPDPTKRVRWGPATTDEMNLGWATWAYKNPEDEDGSRVRWMNSNRPKKNRRSGDSDRSS